MHGGVVGALAAHDRDVVTGRADNLVGDAEQHVEDLAADVCIAAFTGAEYGDADKRSYPPVPTTGFVLKIVRCSVERLTHAVLEPADRVCVRHTAGIDPSHRHPVVELPPGGHPNSIRSPALGQRRGRLTEAVPVIPHIEAPISRDQVVVAGELR